MLAIRWEPCPDYYTCDRHVIEECPECQERYRLALQAKRGCDHKFVGGETCAKCGWDPKCR